MVVVLVSPQGLADGLLLIDAISALLAPSGAPAAATTPVFSLDL